MTIETKSGKTFSCDLILPTTNPDRLYLNVIDAPVHEVAMTFTDEEGELPLKEYPAYKYFDAMNASAGGGVSICLK